MYPGRSVWARGVLALGATTLLLVCPRGTGHSDVVHREPSAVSSWSARLPEVGDDSAAQPLPRNHPRRILEEDLDREKSSVKKRSVDKEEHFRKKNSPSRSTRRSHYWPVIYDRHGGPRTTNNYHGPSERSGGSSDSYEERKRYSRYYTPRSMSKPVAYVHIQPPTPHRKCTRCMVVYKPCPPPNRIVTPENNIYHDPGKKWHGIKYGESVIRYLMEAWVIAAALLLIGFANLVAGARSTSLPSFEESRLSNRGYVDRDKGPEDWEGINK